MIFFQRCALALGATVLACACSSVWAQAQIVVADVPYEKTLSQLGTTLQLNGAGVRYKAVVRVYTAGLYLEKTAATFQEIQSMPGAKRMRIVMLREIDSAELGKLFARGVEDNMDKAAYAKIITGVLRMSQIFTENKRLFPGEEFCIDWIPGKGTVLTVKGRVQGEPFKEPEFFNALLSIWFGPQPADWKLKEALLGKSE